MLGGCGHDLDMLDVECGFAYWHGLESRRACVSAILHEASAFPRPPVNLIELLLFCRQFFV